MRHATEPTLNILEDVLAQVRQQPGLQEKKRGAFYRKGAGFLHFHEDSAGIFADLKIAGAWQRFPVNNDAEYAVLLHELVVALQIKQ